MEVAQPQTVTLKKSVFSDKAFRNSCIVGGIFFVISLIVNYYAAIYASERMSNSVADIILSNFPALPVNSIFSYGPIIFWGVITYMCVTKPKRIPLTLKSIAVFVIVRSAFISMTHLGPFPDAIATSQWDWNFLKTFFNSTNLFLFSSGGDLFFSGHTGLPFLMTLVFWDYKPMRIFCLISAIIFATVVLLGHLHYTIDVASAFFITYTIYIISTKLFSNDVAHFAETTTPSVS